MHTLVPPLMVRLTIRGGTRSACCCCCCCITKRWKVQEAEANHDATTKSPLSRRQNTQSCDHQISSSHCICAGNQNMHHLPFSSFLEPEMQQQPLPSVHLFSPELASKHQRLPESNLSQVILTLHGDKASQDRR